MENLTKGHFGLRVVAGRGCQIRHLNLNLVCAALALSLAAAQTCRSATVVYGNPTPFSSSQTLSAFIGLGFQISVAQPVRLQSAGVYFVDATGDCNIGLYADGANAPGNLMATTGTFPVSSDATIERAFLETPILAPGKYWFAIVGSQTVSIGSHAAAASLYALPHFALDPYSTMPATLGTTSVFISYSRNFYVRASTILAGDYNNDGNTDAADYVVWRKNEGTSTALPNDLIGGTIGTAQYNQWRANVGQSAGNGLDADAIAAIPEPATLILLSFAAIGWSLRRGGLLRK
jgi:hypothetical protein